MLGLKVPSLSRAVSSFFLSSLISVERCAPGFQIFYAQFAPNVHSFLILFERFALFLKLLVSFVCWLCLLKSLVFSSGLLLAVPFEWFAISQVSVERFVPCSQILQYVSSALLLFLKISSRFRAVCSFCSKSPISETRFAPFSQSL